MNRLNGVRAAAVASVLAFAPGLALAQSCSGNLNVKDSGGTVVATAAVASGGETHPCHIAEGLDASGNPHPILTDTAGRVIQAPSGANITATPTIQAAAYSSGNDMGGLQSLTLSGTVLNSV